MWERCVVCHRSYSYSSDAELRARRSRCKKTHLTPEQLQLSTKPVSVATTLFLVLSFAGHRSRSDKTILHLVQCGALATNVLSVFGFQLNKSKYMGRRIKPCEVVHMGFAHKWLPRVAKLLASGCYSAVCYIEDDVRLCSLVEEIVQFAAASQHSIIWAGFDNKPYESSRPGCYQLGTKLVLFKQTGLATMLEIAVNDRPKAPSAPIFRHLDNLLWDEAKDFLEVAPKSMATQLSVKSTIDKKWREGKPHLVCTKAI